ncbi:MAG TPA: lamin tail domain-containing protein, partial [Archangium sp.]|nr:lamin tail domain-containing protein [Archangium sp.]
ATGSYGPYVYCDQSGRVTPPAGTYGTVTVVTPPPPVLTPHAVISEYASKNLKADGTVNHDDEFIELHNPTDSAIPLTGWKIEYKSTTSAAFGALAGLSLSGSIPARGYYLIAQKTNFTGTVTPDATYTTLTSHNGASLRLVDASGAVVDRLAWGTATTTGIEPEVSPAPLIDNASAGSSLERKAYSTSTAATMAAGGAHATRGNGTDSNNNANDFVVRPTRQPQNSSSAVEFP